MKLKLNDYTPSETLRILREWTELDRKDFGASIHKTARSIKNYENNVSKFTVDMLQDIAKKYQLEITIEKKSK